jgi:hypothetical protein
MEVKLGNLIKIYPQLQKILQGFFYRWKKNMYHMCKVGTHHKNDFDEVMPIVQVSITNCEIMDILLDYDSRMNIPVLKMFEEEVRLEEASFTTIYGEDGRSKEGTTSRANIKPQNLISRVHI